MSDEMFDKFYTMFKSKIEAEKPKPKRKINRTYTKEQRARMLENLAKGRKVQAEKRAAKKREQAEKAAPSPAPVETAPR